jgi:cation transport ATPase
MDQSDCAIRVSAAANADEIDHGHTHAPGMAHDHGHDHGHTHDPATWVDYARIAFAALAIAATWWAPSHPIAPIDVFGIAAAVIAGYPIFRHAVQDALRRRMTMEASMTIALMAALVIGETLTALVIVFFVLVAEILEGLTVETGRTSIRELLDRLPSTVDLCFGRLEDGAGRHATARGGRYLSALASFQPSRTSDRHRLDR